MKKTIYALFLLHLLGLSSCIQDEAPNAECDLLQVIVHAQSPSKVFYSLNDTIKEVSTSESTVVFKVRETADISDLDFEFKLTDGATVDTNSLSVADEKVLLALTKSEDKKWSKQYTIRFMPFHCWDGKESFENTSMFADKGVDKYYMWNQGKDANFWATGNPGYKLSRSSAKPEEYPSVSAEGYKGKGVQLVTRSTGSFGAMVGMPIAAGNLFVGHFDVSNALQDAMAATVFGVPFQLKPYKAKFMAKFKPGEVYKDPKGKVVEGKVDKPDFYAVLYRNTDANGNAVLLHGDDAKTNPNIVAYAFLRDEDIAKMSEVEWREISIPFTYLSEIDEEVLANNGYNLTVVFSSSEEGAKFAGAVGSTFSVDELTIVLDDKE